MTWTDDFNRADGPLGNGWTAGSNTLTIAGNKVGAGAGGWTTNPAVGGPGTHDASVVWTRSADWAPSASPIVKASTSPGGWYYATVTPSPSPTLFKLWRYNNGPSTELASVQISAGTVLGGTVGVRWADGVLYGYFNGSLVVQANDNTYAANTLEGFTVGGSFSYVDSFTGDAAVERSMIVVPDPVYQYAGTIRMTAIGTNTEWSAGPPASTTFAVNHGTLYTQVVVDATHAYIYWTPSSYLGQFQFTETQYGLSYIVTETIDPNVWDGGPDAVTPEASIILDRTGRFCPTGTILTTCHRLDGTLGPTILESLDMLLYQLGGFSGQTNPDPTAVSLPSLLYALYENPVGGGHYTVNQLLGILGGSPTIYSHADLLTNLGNAISSEAASILAAIAAVRGAGNPSLASIVTILNDMNIESGTNFQTVLDAIAAIPGTDLGPVLTAIAALRGGTATVQTVRDKLDDLQTSLNSIAASLSALRTGSNLTLQDVLDAIAGISIPPGTTTEGAPVWPGLGAVTIGAPVALTDQLVLDGPMHGVLVDVSVPPTTLGKYAVGGNLTDWGQHRLSFQTDRGDLEPWQYLNFRQGIYTPKSMAQAEHAVFQLAGGEGGTVRTFLRS